VFTGSDGRAHVVGLGGTPVHQWESPDPEAPSFRGVKPILEEPGRLLAWFNNPVVPDCEVDCGEIVEMDWDGRVVWQYEDASRSLHHDAQRLENGNTMLMCSKTILRPEIAPDPIVDDCLVEVTPSGEIVWEWQTADHFDDLDLSAEERELISQSGGGDWAHGNSLDSISSDTPHTDPRFRPGNVIISYRFLNLVIVVDRDTDEIVWQSRESIGQHDARMIRNGLDGAGNIMMLDNGLGGQYPSVARMDSRIVEIDPLTDEVVWTYSGSDSGFPDWTFFSGFLGSVQRLPNGNTFITEGMYGRAFEVDPDGAITWEFVNPTSSETQGVVSNSVNRYTKVPENWVGPLDESLTWP